jgi:hypothetical protein
MEISETQLAALLQDVAELGALQALATLGLIKPYLSQSEAIKMMGRTDFDKWVGEGLITRIKDGPTSAGIRISRLEVESVMKSIKRPSYRMWMNELKGK